MTVSGQTKDKQSVNPDDPKGLIHESYRIEGITLEECRSILIDWALSLPDGASQQDAIARLLDRYGAKGHPMTDVLREGRAAITAPRVRRGGWRSRPRD